MPQTQISMLQGSLEPVTPGASAPEPLSLAEAIGVPAREGHRRRGARRGLYLRRVLLATDALALACALLTTEIATGSRGQGSHSLLRGAIMVLVAVPIWLLVVRTQDHYQRASRRASHDAAEDVGTIVWMTTLWSWGVVLLAPLTDDRTPATSKLLIFWLVTLVYLMLIRSGSRAYARRRSWFRENAIVVGTAEDGAAIIPKLLRHPEYGIRLVASVELPGGALPDWHPGREGVPVIRGEVDVRELVAELGVDRVIFGPSLPRVPDYQEVLHELGQRHVQVDLVPGWHDAVGARTSVYELEGMPVVAVPHDGQDRLSMGAKRMLDMLAAGFGLLALSPLLIACAIAIKLDSPGPVLFRQRRVGRDDEPFEVLKFRSMRADAEQMKLEIAALNFHGGGLDSGMFKIAQDPRITRVGGFLRRHSLDELPQLINVLRGDMSLVGPRPLIENEDRQIEGRHRRRTRLTPGLTGLWQVNGRSDIPFEGMIDLDYLYVTNWSLWGDVKILLRTAAVVTRGRGAY